MTSSIQSMQHVLGQHGVLIVASSAAAAAAATVLALLPRMSESDVASLAAPETMRDRLVDGIGTAAAPIAERFCPKPVVRAVSQHIAVDPRAARLGPYRLIGLASVFGTAIAICAALALVSMNSYQWAFASLFLAPAFVGFVVLELQSAAKKRMRAVRRDFPYALDLLALLSRAGAAPPVALARVADDCGETPLGMELRRAVREISLGALRHRALADMAARVDVPEVHRFVATWQQADELGRPLADTVEGFADQLREQRVQAAEAAAGSAGVRISGPAIIVFVSAIVLLFAPFFLKIQRDGLPF